MSRRSCLAGAVLASVVLVTPQAVTKTNDPAPLTVHEWGTFTSVANADGTAASWQPLSGATDLPCFVKRIRIGTKGDVAGTVRMETPVLYFYALQQTTVNVSVRFRQGLVTEWFPRAVVSPDVLNAGALRVPHVESRISWSNVTVRPGAAEDYPVENHRSHYYAARDTDATPIAVGSAKEKFLFYRGVGRFAPPITATVGADGAIDVQSLSDQPVGTVIAFENRGGAIGFAVGRSSGARMSMPAPVLARQDLAALRRELERTLVAHGLYAKEAAAMVTTWRDSWFEHGARLFYIAPKSMIDSILPLEISPSPAQVARVFVGRMELVTPRTLQEVTDAIRTNDRTTVATYGRFMPPIAARIVAASSPTERAAWQTHIERAYASYYAGLKSTPYCQ